MPPPDAALRRRERLDECGYLPDQGPCCTLQAASPARCRISRVAISNCPTVLHAVRQRVEPAELILSDPCVAPQILFRAVLAFCDTSEVLTRVLGRPMTVGEAENIRPMGTKSIGNPHPVEQVCCSCCPHIEGGLRCGGDRRSGASRVVRHGVRPLMFRGGCRQPSARVRVEIARACRWFGVGRGGCVCR